MKIIIPSKCNHSLKANLGLPQDRSQQLERVAKESNLTWVYSKRFPSQSSVCDSTLFLCKSRGTDSTTILQSTLHDCSSLSSLWALHFWLTILLQSRLPNRPMICERRSRVVVCNLLAWASIPYYQIRSFEMPAMSGTSSLVSSFYIKSPSRIFLLHRSELLGRNISPLLSRVNGMDIRRFSTQLYESI